MARKTLFAPAQRVSVSEAKEHYDLLATATNVGELLNAFPNAVALLNGTRQLVFANDALLETVGAQGVEGILGQRPGEALGCISVHSGEWECGTSERCRYCGAVGAILESQEGVKSVKECRLTLVSRGEETDLDILVTAVPFSIEGGLYTLVTLDDISDEKRRRSLERIFFHDIINTAASLDGLMQFLNKYPDEFDVADELKNAEVICDSMLEDITAQRDLFAAEAGDLAVIPSPIDCSRLGNEVVATLGHNVVAAGKTIEVDDGAGMLVFSSDKRLTRRIITNMIKNALEASPEGSVVTVCYGLREDRVFFTVHNTGFIPRDAQVQLFQRSFSTKGSGRGLGTYSMRLLARYLDGSISFETSEEKGTTFKLELPRGEE